MRDTTHSEAAAAAAAEAAGAVMGLSFLEETPNRTKNHGSFEPRLSKQTTLDQLKVGLDREIISSWLF